MKTVTADLHHEKVQVDADELVLNGPPGALRGNVLISNQDTSTLFIRAFPLLDSKKGKCIPNLPNAFKCTTSLKAGESKMQRINFRAPKHTPPGEYEHIMMVGGKQKRVRMIVQPHVEVEIYPLTLFFQGVKPEQVYSAELTLTNHGNLPFTIPDIKHNFTFDEDYLCRAASMALREKGGEGYMAMMDELTKNIHKDMAGWATVNLRESGNTVAPGQTITLHFTLQLPKNVDVKRDYFGTIRLWNKALNYHIKSH